VAFGLYLALFYAGSDVTQGDVQRIFYIHVAAFSGAFIGFCVTVFGGVQYLRTRVVRWDTLALAGAEVGLALALINLITGSIWARPIWNTWWTWDPRLTSAAIMCLVYAAYLMLRSGIDNPEQRRRFASVYGILAILSAIFTFIIIRVRPDTIHPVVIGPSVQNPNVEGDFAFSERIGMVLGINSAIWSILVPATLIWHRVRLQQLAELVNKRKSKLMNQ
ncbi:MAG: cytochrome c biogenesis protein CcsA, partial [Anaerolineae bacterium]|nr:cytochrome c biogenesis protein CcsA [Anaerolineae bacterium]